MLHGQAKLNLTEYAYKWFDGAATSTIRITAQAGVATNRIGNGFSDYQYDINGRLSRVYNPTFGKEQLFEYQSDANGQILERKEYVVANGTQISFDPVTRAAISGANGKTALYFYANGQRVGEVSDLGAPQNQLDYTQEMARTAALKTGTNYVD